MVALGQAYAPSTTLIDLPRRCHLTYEDDASEPALSQLISLVPQDLWGAQLALQLLAQRTRGAANEFDAYMQLLPARFTGVPLFYSAEAMKILGQYPPVSEQVNKRCRFLLSFTRDHLARAHVAAEVFCGQTIDSGSFGAPAEYPKKLGTGLLHRMAL